MKSHTKDPAIFLMEVHFLTEQVFFLINQTATRPTIQAQPSLLV